MQNPKPLTKAQIEFCKKHLGKHAVDGYLERFCGGAVWTFVDRCKKAGLVEVVVGDGHTWPWRWEGTRITDKGREALKLGAHVA